MGKWWVSRLEKSDVMEWDKNVGSLDGQKNLYHSFKETNHVTDILVKLGSNGQEVIFENNNSLLKDILGAIQLDQTGWHIIQHR